MVNFHSRFILTFGDPVFNPLFRIKQNGINTACRGYWNVFAFAYGVFRFLNFVNHLQCFFPHPKGTIISNERADFFHVRFKTSRIFPFLFSEIPTHKMQKHRLNKFHSVRFMHTNKSITKKQVRKQS